MAALPLSPAAWFRCGIKCVASDVWHQMQWALLPFVHERGHHNFMLHSPHLKLHGGATVIFLYTAGTAHTARQEVSVNMGKHIAMLAI
jgi:hypothetical protein